MKSDENIKKDFWVIAGIMLVILVISSLLHPFYMDYLNKDILLRICATSEKNSEALSNNVRITHVNVNGKDVNLSKIDLSNPWQYDGKNDFIYAYNLENSADLTFELQNVHRLEVTFVKEVGSGYAECYVNEKPYTLIDLYENCDWKETSILYESSLWVFPEKHFIFWICILIFSVIIMFVLKTKRHNFNQIKKICSCIVAAWISSLILVACSICIQYQTWKSLSFYCNNQKQLLLGSIVLVFMLVMSMYLLIQRLWISHMVVGLGIVFLGIVNQIKLLNRGIVLLPWDVQFIGVVSSVIGRYEIRLSRVEIGTILLFLLSVVIIYLYEKGFSYNWNYKGAIVSALVIGATVVFINMNYIGIIIEDNNADYRTYQVNSYFETRGFIPAFLEYCTYTKTEKPPELYDKTRMENIAKGISNKSARSEESSLQKTPTIIAVMSESFWDASRLDTISLEEPLFPVIDSLKEEAIFGNAYTHTINGGTEISEFEFLTGFSGEFFPEDYMVYGKYLREGFDSVVSQLKQQGYKTIALHPYYAENYNRQTAYLNLGFDKSIFNKDFENPEMVRNYISDKTLFSRIISEYESEKETSELPLFIFAVTMQNHGGYWKELITKRSEVDFSNNVYQSDTQDSLSDMLSGLHETDMALGGLIQYFQNVEDEVIVIFFGDHVSDAGTKDDRVLEKTIWKSKNDLFAYETHLVPFIIWSNTQKEHENKGVIEIGQILPIVMDKYGIDSNLFYKFLLNKTKLYAASGNSIIVHSEGDYDDLSNMSENEKKWHAAYELLQYDYIFGKKYTSYLWN